jgi:hypothetical protein
MTMSICGQGTAQIVNLHVGYEPVGTKQSSLVVGHFGEIYLKVFGPLYYSIRCKQF